MSKHTPGPWSNDGTEVGTGILHEMKIAKCCLVGYEETRANARLIAAAPDLLSCMQRLLAEYQAWRDKANIPEDHTNSLMEECRIIVRRAGGE